GRELAPSDGFLILPADQPGIDMADIDRCIAEFSTDTTRIVIATHGERRGHPMIFPASLEPFVRSDACDGGLNALPRTHADRVVTVPCGSPGVIRDIDTPDDYKKLA
ncbi:MAG: NTP transferase domain-containing protein, partial [Planctomycetes bacterium]|nr:NTP transferase domain-containing protein [Planctomycetota bacterium]